MTVPGKANVIYKARARDLSDETFIQNATVSATYLGYVSTGFLTHKSFIRRAVFQS